MAVVPCQPLELPQINIDQCSIKISVLSLFGTFLAYDATLGGWQPGWNGSFTATAAGGYSVSISTIPSIGFDSIRVDVYAENCLGVGGATFWSFTVDPSPIVAPVFNATAGFQSSLNSFDYVWNVEPLAFDPNGSVDSKNQNNYSVVGPSAPARLIQTIEFVEPTTSRVYFDGPLVPGEVYEITAVNISAADFSATLGAPAVYSFTAYGPSTEILPVELDSSQRWDIRNPQTGKDAPEGEPLATFIITDTGDLAVETRRAYLRKRVIRRLTTRKGGLFHEPEYGLRPQSKKLYTPTVLRQLQQDAEQQIRSEPDVIAARVRVSELQPGLLSMVVTVQDEFGDFDFTTEIGGIDA